CSNNSVYITEKIGLFLHRRRRLNREEGFGSSLNQTQRDLSLIGTPTAQVHYRPQCLLCLLGLRIRRLPLSPRVDGGRCPLGLRQGAYGVVLRPLLQRSEDVVPPA
ncbi:unnamed protein product, partial [Musa hybrid cultivar]